MTIERLRASLADRYRIERELGAGGMATVYLAQDLKHDRKVALKVLRPELAATMGPARFFREIQVAARLQHPHILPLHDSGEAGGFLYYVMPYVDGESLRERLARTGELPIHDAVKILMEVVDALAYAHGQGVVHRDIKPDNVMLSGRHALVTDFGVAKAVSEATGNKQLTTAGVALGTPSYMAPEQAAADPHLDHRVDIYALGAMAYELLAGRPPFSGMTPQQVLAAHVTQAPEPVSRHRGAVTPALEAVIMRCLAKRAADRWQSAEELLDNLEPLATPSGGMTPTTTRPIQGVTLATTPVGRRWLLAGGALLALLVGGLGWLALRGGTVEVVQPDAVQVTFTGNANRPALSPDGQRLAYSTRRCSEQGQCTNDLLVQDVGGAGVVTVLTGWHAIYKIQWSDDARFLLVLGTEVGSGHWGPFSVPSLGGGTARWLGCCVAHIGTGDTAIVSRYSGGDSLEWVLRVTLADGIARDSFSVPHRAGWPAVSAWQAAPAGRVLLTRSRGRAVQYFMVERDGRPIDSVSIEDPLTGWNSSEVVRGGRDILVARTRQEGVESYDLIRFRVGADGRIASRADTLLRGLTGWWSSEPNGMLANATGALTYEVWSMTRPSATAMRFEQHRLASATAVVGGMIDPTGSRIALYRRVIQAGKALTQLSVMPADSGAETLVGPPREFSDFDWAQDGRGLVIGTPAGDSVVVSVQDVETGRLSPITSVPKGDFQGLTPFPGGDVAIRTRDDHTILLRGFAGRPDTTYRQPESDGWLINLDPAPDGSAFVTTSWDRNTDSIVVRRVERATLHATRLAAFYAEGADRPQWLRDGTIIVPIRESAATLVWYRIPATGGRPVRLGTPPRAADATFRLSEDGRRVVARVQSQTSDVRLIRNFRELLGERP